MSKTHVLGMAKSNLNLKPGHATRLELDFFKLAFAVSTLRAGGDNAVGYLQVVSEASFKRAYGWLEKYDVATDELIVLLSELDAEDMALLRIEKEANKRGIVPDTSGVKTAVNASSAPIGTRIAEEKLEAHIKSNHPTVERIMDKAKFPIGINWDFYGFE